MQQDTLHININPSKVNRNCIAIHIYSNVLTFLYSICNQDYNYMKQYNLLKILEIFIYLGYYNTRCLKYKEG